MKYVSEILKILDGALRHNVDQASRYAGLLADKLEMNGEPSQANLIRQRLAKLPAPAMSTQYSLPVDRESQSTLVDEGIPQSHEVDAVFSRIVNDRLEEFIEAVEHFSELSAAGVALPTRILMYGPPGCGKTLAARWIAWRLKLPLLTVRCDTLVSSLLGQTGRNLRTMFEHADKRPCVLFLDEFDALAKARSNEREIGELQRVVIALLQNIDSLEADTIVVAATNHEELLDRAAWRRFSFIVPFTFPDLEQRKEIWRRKLGDFAQDGILVSELAERSSGMSGAAIETVAHDIVRNSIVTRSKAVPLAMALRRLARIRWLAESHAISDEANEIRALRTFAPKVFTWRVLENMFDKNSRQMQKIIGEQDERPG